MRFIPHDYQRYCITRIIQEEAIALFLDMGLGKTVITLTAVGDLIFNRFLVGKCLVIAPKKVAEDTWTREQGKWDHLTMLKVQPVLGSVKQRIRALNSPGNVFVVNRENVQWLVDHYRNSWPFDMVVIDESSSFKNHQAKRFKSLKNIRGHIRRLVELTGTPSPNGLMDLWAQVYLLDGGQRLGRTITEYRNNYFFPASRDAHTIFSYEPRSGAQEKIQEQIRDICISLSAKDYLSLPERIDNVRYVQLDQKAQKAYREMEREKVLELPDGILDAGSAAVLSGKLLQLANGAAYHTRETILEDECTVAREVVEIHGNKLEGLMELLEEIEEKPVLIFYNFQHDLTRIRRMLDKTKRTVRELKTPADIADWNAGRIDVLLAHPASVAYGLNLQDGGSDIVWFGLNWNLELYQQANARLHRQGQKHTVYIHHLLAAGTVDEDVMNALQRKGDSQAALLEALKARVDKYFQEKD